MLLFILLLLGLLILILLIVYYNNFLPLEKQSLSQMFIFLGTAFGYNGGVLSNTSNRGHSYHIKILFLTFAAFPGSRKLRLIITSPSSAKVITPFADTQPPNKVLVEQLFACCFQ